MATVKNYWGEVQQCFKCESTDIKKHFKYTPTFSKVIDSVFICGCEAHAAEAEEEYYNRINKQYINEIKASST